MFNLIYRDGAPENTGHYEAVKTDGISAYKVGEAVYLDSTGAAKHCSGATNKNKVYGIVAGDADPSDEFVKVLKVEKDMIFRCPITGTNIDKAVKGFKLAIGTDCGSVIGAAATLGTEYIGVTVADSLNASADGDYIEVRFEN